jgi:hypothetical protein
MVTGSRFRPIGIRYLSFQRPSQTSVGSLDSSGCGRTTPRGAYRTSVKGGVTSTLYINVWAKLSSIERRFAYLHHSGQLNV